MLQRAKRKVLEGVVVSNKMQKTVVVKVIRKVRHPRYEKLVEHWKKYYAHNENSEIKEGQKVKIEETRPLSRTKRWRVVEAL
ncbi:MAG: 30S ribosomal protein S17 [Chlamydiae bacterium]|nr:30S ribosomal protein S17 [Chlamydiota bacterium]